MTERNVCIVLDCGRPTRSPVGDYCPAHQHRVERHGDPQPHIPIRKAARRLPPPEDHDDGTRTCYECRERLPLDRFPKDKRSPRGHRRNCKRCHNAAETARYQADPEAARERMRRYREEDPARARAVDNARYERNKDERIARAIESSHRRRARQQGGKFERGLTVPALRKRDGDRCFYCSVEMVFGVFGKSERPDAMATLEHRLPISRGGGHTADNVVLACWRCNISKGAKTEAEWEAKQGRPHKARFASHPGLN